MAVARRLGCATVRSPLRSPIWQNHAFVRVWAASSISVFGSLITHMAIPFVAILVLDAGPLEVSVLRGLELGTALVVGLIAGAWVDRLRRRPVLIWADLGRAALVATIPVAFVLGVLTIWQLLVVAALASVLTTFFDAADNAYLPTVVRRDQLVEANSALAATGSVAEFTGFGISGFLIAVLTAPIAIALDALTFIVSALLLGGIRQKEGPPPPRSEREPVRTEIAEGLRVVLTDPVLRAFAGARMMHNVLWGIFGGTWLLFATQELGLGPAVIGLVAAVGGLASFSGAFAAHRSTRRWGIGRVAIGAMLILAFGNAFIAFAPAGVPLLALGCLLIQQTVGDSAATVYDITETTVRQSMVPDRQLGRVASTFHVAGVGAQLAATLGAGVLAEIVGLRATILLAPIGGLLGALILWGSPVRGLVSLPGLPDDGACGRHGGARGGDPHGAGRRLARGPAPRLGPLGIPRDIPRRTTERRMAVFQGRSRHEYAWQDYATEHGPTFACRAARSGPSRPSIDLLGLRQQRGAGRGRRRARVASDLLGLRQQRGAGRGRRRVSPGRPRRG